LEETKPDVDVQIEDEAEPAPSPDPSELQEQIKQLQQNLAMYEDKLKRSLADFQNLERKTRQDIENGINEKFDKFMLSFLTIYDDLVRARDILKKENPSAQGLDSIIKNIDGLLAEYDVAPINALGEIFDPNLHEAISVIADENLDDNTITKEIRKGYISHKKTLRPTLVEISKKPQSN
jgi:molecular chaperone GrpE